jgi:hypothetical protein
LIRVLAQTEADSMSGLGDHHVERHAGVGR